ncbi:MAG: hypothetical protein H6838_14305 [Planctomycetes bacterium]|nr:hypothetical protein [Planctomycetota bacterium]MCB9886662.1 hypothetical protein [Planctomycetota bacterium]
MNPELHLRIVGGLQIVLALLHLDFRRRFRWAEELAALSLLNRQIFYVHALFLCFVLVAFGSLSLLAPDALLEPTRLARLVLGGIATFWGLRLFCQWFVYDARLWRGQTMPTVVHWVFTLVWAYFTATYAWALCSLG